MNNTRICSEYEAPSAEKHITQSFIGQYVSHNKLTHSYVVM